MSLVEFAGVSAVVIPGYLRAQRGITRLVVFTVWLVYSLFAFGVRL